MTPSAGLQVDARVGRGAFRLDATFDLAPGSSAAVVGPNGAGKTTLIELLAGLLAPDEGRVVLDGRVLDDPRAGVRVPPGQRTVGIAFQGRRLFPHLSALRNVAFPLEALGTPRAAAERSARDCLARVDGLALAEAPPDRLSGGESQRVALARALVAEPRLLLLDEPFAALDAGARSRLRALLRRLFADFDGIALVVSHDAVDALTLATTVVVIEAGCTVASGSPRDLRLRPPNAFAADLVGLNYFVGNLERVEPGVGALHTAEGSLIVALPPDAAAIPGTQTTAVLSPAAVSLHRARPEGSARNVLAGEIEAVHLDAFRARVRLASAPPVVAEITPASVERLGLEEGTHVWASFKAVEVRLLDAGDHA